MTSPITGGCWSLEQPPSARAAMMTTASASSTCTRTSNFSLGSPLPNSASPPLVGAGAARSRPKCRTR